MRPANLLPPDLRRSGRLAVPPEAFIAVGATVAVGAVLAVAYSGAHGKVKTREQQLAALNAQIAAVPAPKPATITVSPEIAADKDARKAAVDSALSQRVSWDTVLRELSLVLPSDVWLNALSANGATTAPADPTAAPVLGSTSLTITGFTYSQAGVARLLTRLALVPHLDNVQLQSASSSTFGTRDVVGFTIGAQVSQGGSS
jgi:Tfp pilus assembly protein PilN